MRFLDRRRRSTLQVHAGLEDPLAAVANLFDASIVFIVSMMIALFSAAHMLDMLDPKSKVTITKEGADGTLDILVKDGKEIKASRVTDKKLSGTGQRLGSAYRMPDGKLVYVQE